MDGRKFLVVGVLEDDSATLGGSMGAASVYIPYTTAKRLADSEPGLKMFYAAAKDAESMDRAEKTLNEAMKSRFKNDANAFYVNNRNKLAETMNSVTSIFTLLLGGIAAISLLVGGIGIMNIMLVSVSERTREIGIRKAIGAKKFSITFQFMVEALVVCLIGCVVGVALSAVILAIVNAVSTQMDFHLSGFVILVAALFSTGIGVVFGLYPARKAARMNPIDALRAE
jgi:putative ABC transport system permease protein